MTLAADLIKSFEGCELTAYPDPESPRAKHKRATGVDDPALDGRPYTVGYGCTGPGIGPDTEWTQEQADAALAHRLAVLEPRVREICPGATPNQHAAMCSFAWNEGDHALATSEIAKRLNAGDVQGAADDFLQWERAGANAHVLHNRRVAERAIFLKES